MCSLFPSRVPPIMSSAFQNKNITARNMLLKREAEHFASACAENGLKLMFLKGAAMLLCGFAGFDARHMTDVDILVDAADVSRAEEILKKTGFTLMPGSTQAFMKCADRCSPPVIIDLHAGLRHVPDIPGLWSRAVKSRCGETETRVPGVEDMFVHICGHSLMNHGCLQEQSMKDIAGILSAAVIPSRLIENIFLIARQCGIGELVKAVIDEAASAGV